MRRTFARPDCSATASEVTRCTWAAWRGPCRPLWTRQAVRTHTDACAAVHPNRTPMSAMWRGSCSAPSPASSSWSAPMMPHPHCWRWPGRTVRLSQAACSRCDPRTGPPRHVRQVPAVPFHPVRLCPRPAISRCSMGGRCLHCVQTSRRWCAHLMRGGQRHRTLSMGQASCRGPTLFSPPERTRRSCERASRVSTEYCPMLPCQGGRTTACGDRRSRQFPKRLSVR
jgi:hypothetical protein